MHIGIISDTHGRKAIVENVAELLRQRGVSCVLHCGDIDDAETVGLFGGLTVHFVFGNCDMERASIRQAIAAIGGTLQEPFGNLEIEGCKIAWIHGDDKRLLQDLEHSGAFDFLFYGHTHHAEQHRTGPTRVVNPGALQRARVKSFAILDLNTRGLESVIAE
ncbi:MAG TPA: YfcE family phosphodiesterase [Gemmataceae bacterium]|nr:YfcE family phosphodiesterase [Gemmataceae bacterium]